MVYTQIANLENTATKQQIEDSYIVVDVKDQESYKTKKYKTNQLINDILDIIYPIGSIYISMNNKAPSIGNWEKLEDEYYLQSASQNIGDKVGEELPQLSYSNTFTGTTTQEGSHHHNTASTKDVAVCASSREHREVEVCKNDKTGKTVETSTDGSHTHEFTIDININPDAPYNGTKVQPKSYLVSMFKRVS